MFLELGDIWRREHIPDSEIGFLFQYVVVLRFGNFQIRFGFLLVKGLHSGLMGVSFAPYGKRIHQVLTFLRLTLRHQVIHRIDEGGAG